MSRSLTFGLAALLFGLTVSCSGPPLDVDEGEVEPDYPHFALVGSVKIESAVTGIITSSNYTYVTSSDLGLHIVDTSILLIPFEVARYPASGVYGVDVAENFVFMADSDDGLVVVDVTQPNRPREAAVLEIAGSLYDVKVRGDRAYVVGDSGLSVCDISRPNSPSILGRCNFRKARRIALVDDVLYSACLDDGITSVGIEDGTNPTLFGNLATFDALDVAINGRYAYVADGRNGLKIVDIQDPRDMRIASKIHSWGDTSFTRIAISWPYAFILNKWYGMLVYDIRSPLHPDRVLGHRANHGLRAVHVFKEFVLVAGGPNGVEILQRKNF